jgi:hypothetical protein
MAAFWEIMLLLILKRQDFVQFFLLKNCAKYCLDPEPEFGTGIGTTINHSRSTASHSLQLDEKDDMPCTSLPHSLTIIIVIPTSPPEETPPQKPNIPLNIALHISVSVSSCHLNL